MRAGFLLMTPALSTFAVAKRRATPSAGGADMPVNADFDLTDLDLPAEGKRRCRVW
jgi:hypothetical protein